MLKPLMSILLRHLTYQLGVFFKQRDRAKIRLKKTLEEAHIEIMIKSKGNHTVSSSIWT